ncbi:hypothetical protein AMC81_CH02651 [Rhizobium phaseoli]|uniref:Uncharacterized protein n=1 Tax=Rhizobium phaseoli TaxID=396 RepID=A0ABM6CAZ6_9HYPH|nr:hypothetical protein AMC81_CH02651 [Rhizobium phaseoli]ANL91921.1 hypothetical protein AMC80_CH02653 [Rhizobium phaseoli]
MRFEIDMQPFGAARTGNPRGFPNQLRGDALPAHVGVNAGVEKEGMNAAVPGDVDEADEAAVVIGADMGEAAGRMREKSGGLGVFQVADQRVLSSLGEGKGSMRNSGMGWDRFVCRRAC